MKGAAALAYEDFNGRPAESPRPLMRDVEAPEEFPLEALPAVLGDAVRAIVAKVQCPEALAAQSVLSVASLATQGLANVRHPVSQKSLPISCFMLSICESGERKSTADAEAMAPVRAFEAELKDEYRSAFSSWKNRQEAFEGTRRKIMADKKLGYDDRLRALEELGEEPERPLHWAITAPEPTVEGLVLFMKDARASLGIFATEGGQFLGGYGMSPDHAIKTCTAISLAWDAEEIRRMRASDGFSALPGRRLAMHLLVQPSLAAKFLGDRELRSQGILSRFLAVAPQSKIGQRLVDTSGNPPDHDEANRALSRYTQVIGERLRRPLALAEGERNALDVPTLSLDQGAARRIFAEFHNAVEEACGPDGAFHDVQGFASKSAEHALRLASVLQVIEDPEARTIGDDAIDGGVMLARYYLNEQSRLAAEAMIVESDRKADRLRRWLCEKWPHRFVSLPDIYQRWGVVRTPKEARALISPLEEAGWLRRMTGPVTIEGATRKEAWEIISNGEA